MSGASGGNERRSDAASKRCSRLAPVVLAFAVMSVSVGCRPVSDGEEQRPGGHGRQGATARRSLSPDESRRIIQRMNVAVGRLENEDSAEAEPLLEELREAVPGEIAFLRNLAICRLLIVEDLTLGAGARTSPQERARALEEAMRKARATIDQLIDADRDSAIALWLRGKVELVASAESGLEKAAVYLERAAAKEPDNIIVRYELYNAARYASDEAFKPRGIKALGEAYEARPDNLFLMLLWLDAQVATKEPSIVDTLRCAKEQLGPIRGSITSADVFALIDAAREAARQGNWPGTQKKIRPLLSVTKPQDAVQSDRKELSPRVVEYVVSDLSPEFYKRNPPGKPAEPPAIEVAMERIAPQFPSVENVWDMDLVDFDVDGALDVVLLRPGRVEVFSNQARATGWTRIADVEVPTTLSRLFTADLYMVDVPEAPKKRVARSGGVQASRSAQQEAKSEIAHHNVYPGMAVFGTGGIRLLRNNLDRQPKSPVIESVEQSAQMQQLAEVLRVIPADLDHDGDLDLVVAAESGLSLWSNRSNMTFEDISRWSALPASGVRVTGKIAVDWDRDGDIDVLLSGPAIENGGLLENVRHGKFRWMPFGEPYGPLGKATSVALVDADGNRSWDVLAAGPSGVRLVRTTTPRPGDVEHLCTETLAARPQDGCAVWDFDNDGNLDVLTWGEGIHVLRGTSDENWREVPDMVPEPPAEIIRCVPADLDDDGDLDLAVAAADGVTVYANRGGNKNRWLAVRVRGTDDRTKCGRVNHYCIGSLLEVRNGAHYQARVLTRQTTHFGLGNTERADVLRMLLTNGVPQHVVRPEADQLLREFMTSKGM